MRILSFSKRWQKLSNPVFTTFRFPRRDEDWQVGEMVQVYYKNRTPQRERLGEAKIINKELRKIATVTEQEAIADGFANLFEMNTWFRKTQRIFEEPINKLTLRWVEQSGGVG